jgi:hypothetical protein
MAPIHAKSPCCHARVARFGKRRRQCTNCKHTWSIRKKKRGPKRIRTARALVARVLIEGYTLRQESKHFPCIKRSGIAKRFAQELQRVAVLPQSLPRGPQALIVDGVYFKFKRREWVLYLMALKPIRAHRMYFLDPVLIKGREKIETWHEVIETIPRETRNHIRGLVSDGLRGFQGLAAINGWVHQRCHFHLLSSLVRGKGKRRYLTHGSPIRDEVLRAVRVVLADEPNAMRGRARQRLVRYSTDPACPAYIRKHISEFLEREQDFRAYLTHPKLNLPTTTNAMESSGKLVRKAVRTARTSESLKLRAVAFLRLKRTVQCNSSDTQN